MCKQEAEVTAVSDNKNQWLTIKCHHAGRFFYVERKGIDSVAVVLLSSCGNYIGLINEGKPPFAERNFTDMPMMPSAIGGSLFDRVTSDEQWLSYNHDEAVEVAKFTAIAEVKEELGHSCIDIHFVGKNFNNSMSNEYIYGFLAIVDKDEKRNPNPQSETEALAEPVWYPINKMGNIQCGKAKTIIFDALSKELIK